MKVALLFTGSGAMVVVTSHDSLTNPALLAKLKAKGIAKFAAWEIPVDMARQRYGGHYQVVMRDLGEADDLRILDYNGQRAFQLFAWSELGEPVLYDGMVSLRGEERMAS